MLLFFNDFFEQVAIKHVSKVKVTDWIQVSYFFLHYSL